MKYLLFLSCLVLTFSFCNCSGEPEHRVSGQWQLKTMQKDGVVSEVDTVFFAFQRGVIFSFTLMWNENDASVSYGYMDVPSENVFRISMDASKNEDGHYTNMDTTLLLPYGWTPENNFQQTFTVESLDGKRLTLSSDGTVYHLNKH